MIDEVAYSSSRQVIIHLLRYFIQRKLSSVALWHATRFFVYLRLTHGLQFLHYVQVHWQFVIRTHIQAGIQIQVHPRRVTTQLPLHVQQKALSVVKF